uniref:Snake toxin/toxin-like domain-containing protein n=1 Tax=Sparus aurata TaxID=8175 RepID=A0A671Y608_SPAAU
MKTVILALLVSLVVAQGEALTCNCGGVNRCSSPVKTCSSLTEVCASITIFYSKDCMESDKCMELNRPGARMSFTCCSTDLCNK